MSRSLDVAQRIYNEIVERVDRLAAGHLVGHNHPDAPAQWLYLKHKRWLVFYRLEIDGIYIMRVIDAVRDLPAQLADDTP